LLACGDIHPCPGPTVENTSSIPDVDFTGIANYNVFKQRGLHFIHLNVRSLISKLDEVRLLAVNTRAACICITESWLDDSISDSEVSIDNYVIQRKDRDRQGGGVCIYVRCDFAYNPRDDLCHEELEATWLEILLPKSKPILCGALYRPPKQMNFYSILETVCSSSVHFLEYETILMGDMNTNISSLKKCTLYSSFCDFINMFHFKQLVNNFTRVCKSSSSTIDLILVSDCDNIVQSGVLDICISDHQPVYCTRKLSKTAIGEHNTVKARSLKHYNKDDFQQSLLSEDWSSVINCDIATEAWLNFKSIFLSVINNIAPVKEIRIKQRTASWIKPEILQSISERDKAFYLYKRDKSEENFNSFKQLRNKTQSMILNAKQNYFTDTLEENKSDSKSLWKALKNLGLPSKKTNSSSSSIGLNINGVISFNKLHVAEKFNSFYVNVASNLVKKLPSPVFKFGKNFVQDFYSAKGVLPDSFSFNIVSDSKVLKYLNMLSPKKATGLDGIPSRFVKDSAPIIAGPLSHIINLSLIQGVVPDDLKSARVVPLYKKNDKTEVGNYRPVSILSILSKIYERVVYDQVEEYLSKNNLLYMFQSGFRRGFSTDTCLIHLSDYIRFQMDQGNLVGMILLDLQKAFDTVDHGILLMKMEAMGLGKDILRWFKSYLSERQQLVNVAGSSSSYANITCGVPQGSILGPLLFLIYVNDMSAVVKNKLLLYADDSGILVAGKNKSDIESSLNEELDTVSKWLIDNKLSLHLGKTESILFGSKPRLRSSPNLNISCNGQVIEPTSYVKYLGATLDQSLSCESMASSVIKKANSRLKFLYRKRNYLTQHTKKLLVMSLIQCHFDYACCFWFYGLSKMWKTKLQVTQNKILRFVLNLDHRSHIGPVQFLSENWLPVSKRVDQIILNQVFKIVRGSAPEYLGELFVSSKSVHSHSTRFSEKGSFSIPKVKSFGIKSFAYMGCTLWNSLPRSITEIEQHHRFKDAVKNHFLSQF
jgi:hypothetical protein